MLVAIVKLDHRMDDRTGLQSHLNRLNEFDIDSFAPPVC
jgi:hypothetical protein